MAKIVTVTVLREHSGDAGHHPEKSDYSTSLQHARELRAQGLVEFDEDSASDSAPAEDDASPAVSRLKSQPAPRNKAEKAPANKAEVVPKNKAEKKPAASTVGSKSALGE